MAELDLQRAYTLNKPILPGDQLRRTKADLAKSEPPRWAVRDRIIIGGLSIILGEEGLGKGVTVSWILAQLTNGSLPGEFEGVPINAAVIGDEDSWHDVWTPRLHAAGADLDRVQLLEGPEGAQVEFGTHRDAIVHAVREDDVRVIFCDALVDNIGRETNDWHGKEVRSALEPAKWLAKELDIAIIGAHHPNGKGTSFRTLFSGSKQFIAVARSCLLLAQHPDSATGRVLCKGKGNYANPAPLEFDIESIEFDTEHEDGRNLHWNQPVATNWRESEFDVHTLLNPPKEKKAESKTSRCERYILENVTATPSPAAHHEEMLALMGIESRSTITTAKLRTHTVSDKLPDGGWVWHRTQ
jgi:hypothetical protein